MVTDWPCVHIILINWNRLHDTLECLDSLAKLEYPVSRIVVVDNGSSDDSQEVIVREHPNVVLLENDRNLGFTEANNIAIQYSLENGADYCWLLNNDTVVHKEALTHLVAAVRDKPSIGVASPKILYHATNRIWFAGNKLSLSYGRPLQLGHRGFGCDDTGQYDAQTELGFCSGCSMLVCKEVFEQVGLLDNDYFAYYEDLDFSLRVKRNDYRIVLVPEAIVWHKEASSSNGRISPVRWYLLARNRWLFMRKNGPTWGWPIFVGAFLGSILRDWAKRYSLEGMAPLRWSLVGVWDFLCCRWGKSQVVTRLVG